MHRHRVLLADDHPGIVEVLAGILSRDFELIGTVGDGLALLDTATRLQPDVIVSDISMPGLDGLQAVAELAKRQPSVKVVLVTMYHDAAFADAALSSGAHALVLKHEAAHQLVPAVRATLAGQTFVSPALGRPAAGRTRPTHEPR